VVHSSARAEELGGWLLPRPIHPRGIPDGPHPGTIVASKDVRSTDELAVMVDTSKPLKLTRQAIKMDDPSYPLSWID
jgi:homogentisate 1,2-dioxygenase